MEHLERIKADHKRILTDIDHVAGLLPGLGANSLPMFIARLWELISAIEEHEEFEERHFLIPLSGGTVGEKVLLGVDRVRREHGRIFDRLAGLQDGLSSYRSLPAEEWNDDKRGEIKLMVERVFEYVRDHIHRENIGLYSLIAEHSDIKESLP